MLKTNNSFPSKINENLSTTKTLLHQKTVIYDLNIKTIPWQRMPLPKYPSIQVQLYEPRVLVHFAFSWHSLRSEAWHSSKSVSCRKATPDQKRKGYVEHTLSILVKTLLLEWCFAVLVLSAPRGIRYYSQCFRLIFWLFCNWLKIIFWGDFYGENTQWPSMAVRVF